MLENIKSILSTVQKEYGVKEEEAKKIIEKILTNYFTQLQKSENGTAPVIFTKTTIKNTVVSSGTMTLGATLTAAGDVVGGPILIGLGISYFGGSKLVQNLRGMNKSTRVSEGREAAFSGQSLEKVALHNNQLNLEALKDIIANDYTKQLVATLLIAYEKQKKQEKLGQNGSKKTFKQKLSSVKESAAEYTSKTLEKVNLSTDKPAYYEKTSDHFNIIFKRVQDILITLDDNLNLVGLKLFISNLNHPELVEIINNINSNLNPSKEECLDLTWVIATAEFLLKKQAEHQKNPAKINIIQSLLKQLKEPIYNEINYSQTLNARPRPNLNTNIHRTNSTRYIADPTRGSIRQPQMRYDEQHYLIPNHQNSHTQPQYDDVYHQSQSNSTSQTTYIERPITNSQARAATLPRPPKTSSSGIQYQPSPLSRVGSVTNIQMSQESLSDNRYAPTNHYQIPKSQESLSGNRYAPTNHYQTPKAQESLSGNRYNHFSRENPTRSSTKNKNIQVLHEKLNLENNLPRLR
ncbi:MAG: hypothetical protein V4471_07300 [Pseudomonadota bacterium]